MTAIRIEAADAAGRALPARGRWRRHGAAWLAAALLAACGGGGGGESAGEGALREGQAAVPASRAEAQRFLTQATFGPVDADVERVMALGYGAWIDEQFARPASSHLAQWAAYDAALKADNAGANAGQDGVFHSFWKTAVAGDDQLRQRVAYALSQIFVISMMDGTVGDNPKAVAAWLDMLADKGLGTYRELLEAVALHPMMGVYLTHLRNQKADPKTGRVPDENFAREVMQLFSIGVVELNLDGTPRTAGGVPAETYGSADIAGLARVFTGWSWDCPDAPDNNCFFNGHVGGSANGYPDRTWRPMTGYGQYHSREEKRFLGVAIAEQGSADPRASLKTALDTLAGHPNVGPFIGRQLIQRLVTSNPSPAYVAAVAQVFNDNGSGVRGDLRAVVKAVLTHPEARAVSETSGKLREPVLRLSALLRAFDFRSDSGWYRVGNTDNAGTSLGQSVLRSPSVFNFYRPGYVPPSTAAAARGLAVPEMQITHETTTAGYVNFMRDGLQSGIGQGANVTVDGRSVYRRDLQPAFAAELALADDPAALVERVNDKLMLGAMPRALKDEIEGAVGSIAIPALNKSGSNQASIDNARRNRVNAAVFLALVSPEYQVQK